MDKQILVDFEKLLKTHKVIKFDKIWEKTNSNYKLIYNIEGLAIDTKFYANVKLIFWMDSNKENLSENVITYLYALTCDYKSITITNIEETFNNILSLLDKEQTNIDLSEFIINGTDSFNKEIKNNGISDFIQNINFVAQGNMPCVDIKYKFELKSNDDAYIFYLKPFKGEWQLTYESNKELLPINDVPKKLIEWIYEIK
jgi:monomeric isocitrate dehydrogenase